MIEIVEMVEKKEDLMEDLEIKAVSKVSNLSQKLSSVKKMCPRGLLSGP